MSEPDFHTDSDEPGIPSVDETPLHRSLVVAAFASVLLLPLVFYGCGPEWARWDAAQAVIAYDKGDIDHAIFQLTTAIERSPRDPTLKINLAKLLIRSGRAKEAEALCDEVLQRFRTNNDALITKTHSQQTQGEFARALETFNEQAQARNWLIGSRPDLLNQRAYFRALARVRLPEARQDIDDALAMIARVPFGTLPFRVSMLPRSLVACTLIGRQFSDDDPELLDQIIDRLSRSILDLRLSRDKMLVETNRALMASASLEGTTESPTDQASPNQTQDQLREKVRLTEDAMAVLLVCRALCYQDQEKDDLRDQDRNEVSQMAYDGDDLLAKLPGTQESVATLQASAALLDTRGLVLGLLPEESNGVANSPENTSASRRNLRDGLDNLDQAVFAYEILVRSLDSDLLNFSEGSEIDLEEERKDSSRNVAIFRYHRYLILRRMGDMEAAGRDESWIRSAGLEPGPHLF